MLCSTEWPDVMGPHAHKNAHTEDLGAYDFLSGECDPENLENLEFFALA
jgi:hypothetical protein